ncbi:Tn3 family transposase [Streptomyces sp. NPDC017435]|uniref:Tn3 family transposase n=1 Tax=Streptomyces sp. NPDC017435 TaxID=3364995 RepID=UPI0037A80CE4
MRGCADRQASRNSRCPGSGRVCRTREVGRVIRTVQLLRYLSDAPLRRRVTAATNKVESFNRFSQWIGFGNPGVVADNTRRELRDYFNRWRMRCRATLTSPVR